MSEIKEPRRVSASRLNAIKQCTMKFYLSEVCGLPEKVWARTSAGSASHGILECLSRPKHRHHHDEIKSAQTIEASPAVSRLLRAWIHKTKMPENVYCDIDKMCLVAINHTNFLDEGATQRFDPEHEFRMTLSNGAVVKGFLDRVAIFGDKMVISDYKTARNKMDKEEVVDSYQALTYQLWAYRTHGVLAEVRFFFLRHGPSKRYPNNHVMITMPATPAQLEGFEQYLEHMWEVINRFSMKEAVSGYCADTGFCDRVCSYRIPFSYMVVKKEGEKSRKYWIDPKTGQLPYQVKEGETSEILNHFGCPRWNPQ